ncbi:hypothetical protein HDG38_001876 [Paraburkholderia sp. WSM4177]|nr:hypothetical protein [Paraburkholderia sp. WSM4177]MBB5483128.1 hypothetical protein [Paraburkholderia sp. WSM4180]
MSVLAKDLLVLRALPKSDSGPRGALTEHLMREIARALISRGAA